MRPPALRSARLCRRFCICVGNRLLEDEAAETQRTPFSRAEFMPKEQMKPIPQPATASLFEWALDNEREREAEPVADRRDSWEAVAPSATTSHATMHMCGIFAFQEGEWQMKPRNDLDYKMIPRTCRRYEVIEMHLFDDEAADETPLCGAGVSVHDLISVDYYLDRRKDGLPVGTVCDGCKALMVPFAVNLSLDLEADGRVVDADDYFRLADRLTMETASVGPARCWPSRPCVRSFCVYLPWREAVRLDLTASPV